MHYSTVLLYNTTDDSGEAERELVVVVVVCACVHVLV